MSIHSSIFPWIACVIVGVLRCALLVKGLFCFISVQQQHRTNTPPCCLLVVPISWPDLPSKLPSHRNSRADPRPGQLAFYSPCAKTDTRPATEGSSKMWHPGFLYKAYGCHRGKPSYRGRFINWPQFFKRRSKIKPSVIMIRHNVIKMSAGL